MAKINMKQLTALHQAILAVERADMIGKGHKDAVKGKVEALDAICSGFKSGADLAEGFVTILAAEIGNMDKAQVQTRKRSMSKAFNRTHEGLRLTISSDKGGNVSSSIIVAPTKEAQETNRYKKAADLLASVFPGLKDLPVQVDTMLKASEKAAEIAEADKVELAATLTERANKEEVATVSAWLESNGMEVTDQTMAVARLAMAN